MPTTSPTPLPESRPARRTGGWARWACRRRLRVLGEGSFFCPGCLADADYRHLRARRWLAAGPVPVVPLRGVATYVECGDCGGTFAEASLRVPTTAQLEHQLGLAARAAYAKLAATVTSPVVRAAAADEVRAHLADGSYSLATLLADAAVFGALPLEPYVGQVAPHLRPLGRLTFAQDLARVAVADAQRAPADLSASVVAEAGRALGLGPAEVRGLLARARAGSDRPAA